jgi:hypothetical protein
MVPFGDVGMESGSNSNSILVHRLRTIYRGFFPVNFLLGFGNTHSTSAADRITSEHDTQVTINLQMSHPSGLVVLKKSTTSISPLFVLSSYNASCINRHAVLSLIRQASQLFNIRIGLVARICRSHSSLKKTRSDKAGVQFPDSESEIVLLLLAWSSGIHVGRR